MEESWIVVTAIGIFDVLLDGRRISEDYFSPGFTDYEHNLQYCCYRIGELQEGDHELFVTVAAGWAVGRTTNISEYKPERFIIDCRPAGTACRMVYCI